MRAAMSSVAEVWPIRDHLGFPASCVIIVGTLMVETKFRREFLASAVSEFASRRLRIFLPPHSLLSNRLRWSAMDFFELSQSDIHAFSCDCGGSISNAKMADRIEKIARGPNIYNRVYERIFG